MSPLLCARHAQRLRSRRPQAAKSPCPLGVGTDVAPYKANTPAAPRRCSPLQGPLRQRLTALTPPLKGEAGWVVQTASVVTRTRGILRRCAPQDDKGESAPRNDCLFVILSGTTWSEESRACAFARQGDYTKMARRVVAPYGGCDRAPAHDTRSQALRLSRRIRTRGHEILRSG